MIYSNQFEALRYIFLNHPKLKEQVNGPYVINFEGQILDVKSLKSLARKWTFNERFLLHLALNLFDLEDVKVDLSRINRLNEKERDIALTAIRIRFDLI